MSNFNGLRLDADKIPLAINEFPGATSVKGPTNRGKFVEWEVQAEAKDPVALLQVYARGDGTTTLHYKVGKNQPLSEQVAAYVAERAASGAKFDSPTLTLKSITEDEWKFLLESLDAEGLKLTQEPHQHAERYKVLAAGSDQVVIHRFNTGTFLMQGKPVNAYGKVVDCLCYATEEKKAVIEAQLATIDVKDITSDGLLAELEQRIPHAWAVLNETVKCIFAPSLALTKLAIDLPDYSCLCHPALRGLEGCMKDLFQKNHITPHPKFGLGGEFDQNGTLKAAAKAQINCPATVTALEKFYALYNQHRNSLFHTDNATISSRLIDKKQEAVEIVNSVLFTVEQGFAAIP